MKRRDLLKGASAAFGGGVATSSVAAAEPPESTKPPHASLRDEYESPADIVSPFETHAEPLLAELSEDGLLSTSSISGLAPDADEPEIESRDSIEVMSTRDDETDVPTAVLRVSERFEDGRTDVFVMPEAERSYARIEYDSGEQVLRLGRSPAESKTVSTSADCVHTGTTTRCSSEQCDTFLSCGDRCPTHFNKIDIFEHFECTETVQLPDGSEGTETYTTKQFVSSDCSPDCCSSDRSHIGCLDCFPCA